MNFLYNTAISTYALAARVAALRSKKAQLLIDGQKNATNHIAEVRRAVAPNGFDLWFHVASLGEFEQARPLIEAIRDNAPDKKILLTFFSPSGYTVRANYDKVDCVAYLPFDKPKKVKDFLDATKPQKAIFVKYEFWGNFLTQLKDRNIPVILIDAIFRPGQMFFRKGGGIFRRMLSCYSHVFVQDQNSKSLLSGIGVNNVTVAGDTRFDRVATIRNNAFEIPQIQQWLKNKKFNLVVGSSWQPDEDRYIPWLNNNTDVPAIIAPHEFDAARIDQLRQRFNGKTILWSEIKDDKNAVIPSDAQILIIDAFGLLSSLYRYGSVAIIGGGFGAGIHNINEAAVYGIPVLFGPNNKKFKEAQDLINCGGAVQYNDKESLARSLNIWKNNPIVLSQAGSAAEIYIQNSLGASKIILPYILQIQQ